MKTVFTILAIAFVLSVNAQNINTVVGTGSASCSGDGNQATLATIYGPAEVTFDAVGNMYIADFKNNRVRKVNTSGVISTFAGTGVGSYSGDGNSAVNACLNGPNEVAVDAVGNVYIVDGLNNVVRKVNTSGVISTFAGTGVAGYSGDGSSATSATLSNPYGIAIDGIGNVYIADINNNCIRMVDTSGIINTIAGNGTGSFSGDGNPAINATLNNPAGLAIDTTGNLYIVDDLNNRIRKINTSGIISTVAGNGSNNFNGDGSSATSASLNHPRGISLDASGNLYIADKSNNRIRKVNTLGIISTIAGNGSSGFSGDGSAATSAALSNPIAVNIDASGSLYISDYSNNRIRKISATTNINQVSGINKQITVYPNPTTNSFIIETNTIISQKLQLLDINGKVVLNQFVNGTTTIDTGNLSEGVYTICITTNEGIVNKKMVIVK